MCSDIAISVKHLSKAYRIFGHPTDRIKQMLTLGKVRFHREFTALQDVSFEIRKGETVGIIGRNGSGKSTLLQLICGILKPTTGGVKVNGRISALLELGSGFNPEFTGRENVYFQGAIMGLSKSEMDLIFDEIATFADIGEFIDQPVRTYSSGMFVRLAFAVAISANPDILIVDEALAVGDEAFQYKCFARIRKFHGSGGTVLFVSHSSPAIAGLCSRVILIDSGKVLVEGGARQVLARYQRLLFSTPNVELPPQARSQQNQPHAVHPNLAAAAPQKNLSTDYSIDLSDSESVAYEARGALISNPRIETTDGEKVNILMTNKEYLFKYRVAFQSDATLVRYGMLIKTASGFELCGLVSHPIGKGISHINAGASIDISLPFRCSMLPGVYFVNAGVFGDIGTGESYLHRIADSLSFKVMDIHEQTQTGIIDISTASNKIKHQIIEP